MKTLRVTLDIQVRPLTQDEIDNCGMDGMDDDCMPTGTDADILEAAPYEYAALIENAFHEEVVSELFAGSNIFASFEKISAASSEWLAS